MDAVLTALPTSHAITDCKSLYDAVKQQESSGLGIKGKRTAIELTAIRQTKAQTNVKTWWVNYDRQLADILTKPTVNPSSLQECLRRGRWKIVYDPSFTRAKNMKAVKRDKHFANVKAKHKEAGTSRCRHKRRNLVKTKSKQGKETRPWRPFQVFMSMTMRWTLRRFQLLLTFHR